MAWTGAFRGPCCAIRRVEETSVFVNLYRPCRSSGGRRERVEAWVGIGGGAGMHDEARAPCGPGGTGRLRDRRAGRVRAGAGGGGAGRWHDPLHLAGIFGLDDKIAIRYANAAPAPAGVGRRAMRCHGFSAIPRIQPTVLSPTDPWVPAENPSVWLNPGLSQDAVNDAVTRGKVASRCITPVLSWRQGGGNWWGG